MPRSTRGEKPPKAAARAGRALPPRAARAAVALLAGTVFRPGEGASEGWVLVEGARVADAGEGAPPREPDARGLVMPTPVDAHTHVGDMLGRGVPLQGRTLAEVVAPPDGLKHRLLRDAPEDALLDGMRRAVRELLAAGCGAFVDFRERGARGVDMLRRACEGAPVRAVALGRPAEVWTEEEMARVLAVADGFGLSALADLPGDAPERAAAASRRAGKRLALHLSEAVREDVGRALDLRPDFLVHMASATREDLAAVARAGVPVVTCPRSNDLFGLRADVPAMLDLGVALALGSDNAMFHPLDPLLDARLLGSRHPEVPREAWLEAATAGGRRVLDGAAPRSWLRPGDAADAVVLAPQGERDPLGAVFGPAPPRVAWTRWRLPEKG